MFVKSITTNQLINEAYCTGNIPMSSTDANLGAIKFMMTIQPVLVLYQQHPLLKVFAH